MGKEYRVDAIEYLGWIIQKARKGSLYPFRVSRRNYGSFGAVSVTKAKEAIDHLPLSMIKR